MSKKKYDVIVVGELNVDLILNKIESFPEMGKEKIAREMSLVLGSSSAILASNLSSLGSSVGFIGKIGNDIFGELALKALNEKKVDTSLIIKSDQYRTGATIVMSVDNDRANITYPGAMETLTLEDIPEDALQQARHLHFSSYFLQPGMKNDLLPLLQKAKALGLSTSVDPQWDPSEKWEIDLEGLLPFIDFFMPNVAELTSMMKESGFDTALRKVNPDHTLILKMGTEGSCLYKNGQKTIFPPFLNEEVVDTIGAGDSFNAGFLHKFLEGAPLEDCMVFASLTGAVSTTAAGGTGAFTSYENVLEIIKNKFSHSVSHETTR